VLKIAACLGDFLCFKKLSLSLKLEDLWRGKILNYNQLSKKLTKEVYSKKALEIFFLSIIHRDL
jgi:hypothetical protein